MTIDQLQDLQPGDQIAVYCRTTDKNIYYKGVRSGEKDYTGRQKPVLFPPQVTEVHYTIVGQAVGLKLADGKLPDFLLVEYIGEAANVPLCKIDGMVTRLKQCQIPLSAIVRITTAREWAKRRDYKLRKPPVGVPAMPIRKQTSN